MDPRLWDDTNDSHFLALYRERNRFKSVLALCFTQTSETYHQWKVFAHGPSGVCICFRRRPLLSAIRNTSGLRAGAVRYLKVKELGSAKLKGADLPFLKRYPFEHEKEFRLIYESLEEQTTLDIPIPLSCIERITLSPWLPKRLSPDVKKVLWSISGCRQIDIARSTLISNEEWKTFGESATKRRSPGRSK
jgi:hypothetical protein